MTWVVPETVPTDEPFLGEKREMLQGFLRFGRESLLRRCGGLTPEQLVIRSAPPSALALDHTYTSPRWGAMSLRWVYLHMIREYSGHIGQADIIRERIDGRTHG